VNRSVIHALSLSLAVVLLGLPSSAFAARALAAGDVAQLQDLSNTFVRIAEAITPAVVGISTSRVVSEGDSLLADPYFRWFFGNRDSHPRQREEQGLGSGVLVSPDGLIVTNAHVVEGAEHIKVTLSDRRSFKASTVGVDVKTDLAVLRIDAKNLPWVPLGDSTSLRPGELVLAVGNPFGLSQTVTMGIISGVGRQGVGITDYEDFIQTDAAINPGNSGGAMINTRGQLIGVNTAIFTQSGGYEGIGFAIPSALVKTVMDSLLEHGRVVRGWLGVSIQEVTPDLAVQFGLPSAKGALVTDVISGGPAAAAGLRRGDVIIAINGEVIDNLSRLRLMVAGTPVGARVKVKILRENKTDTIKVTLGELPEDIATLVPVGNSGPVGYDNVLAGLTVSDLSPDAMRRYRLDTLSGGVVVLDVAPGSAVSRAGILPGDVIVEVDRQLVDGVDGYTALARAVGPQDQVLLLVSRQGRALYVGVSP
jgi:serine protease Do